MPLFVNLIPGVALCINIVVPTGMIRVVPVGLVCDSFTVHVLLDLVQEPRGAMQVVSEIVTVEDAAKTI